ncbi:hypothetical protein DEU34_2258 [Microbacterium sp. AG1240]|nr:hypothetical protein DEU34_2258 [Microbacterium sp. AG1240]
MREREIRYYHEGKQYEIPVHDLTSDEGALAAALAVFGTLHEREVTPWRLLLPPRVVAPGKEKTDG